MRGYVFTDNERLKLRCWLESGVEDDGTRKLFVAVRRNLDRLANDVELLVLVCRGLREEGRLAGRGRLPRGFGRRLPSGG